MSDLLSFQIIGPATYQPLEEYQRFINALGGASGLVLVEAEDNSFHLIARDRIVGTVSLADYDDMSDDGLEKRPLSIHLQVPRTDRNIAQFVRAVIAKTFKGYSFYSDGWTCLLPIDPNLLSFEINPLDNDIDIAMRDRELIPRFLFVPTQATFGEAPDGSIHSVNSSLVAHFVREARQSLESPADFSYPVAPSLQRFGILFNHGLIPVVFYEYWQKSMKVINHSFFDLDKMSRKLFIRPVIFDLEPSSIRLHPAMVSPVGISRGIGLSAGANNLSGAIQEDGRSGATSENNMVPASLALRPGETLSQIIINLLSKDLRIADDFARALIMRDISFERDEDGVLTPLLTVHIFLDKITNRDRLNDLFNSFQQIGEDETKGKIIN